MKIMRFRRRLAKNILLQLVTREDGIGLFAYDLNRNRKFGLLLVSNEGAIHRFRQLPQDCGFLLDDDGHVDIVFDEDLLNAD
jgi:hypothetical protein